MNERKIDPRSRASRYKATLWSALAAGLLFLVLSVLFYRFTIRTLVTDARQREGIVTREIARGLEYIVETRAQALQTVVRMRPEIFAKDRSAEVERTLTTIVRQHPGFYALAWVRPDGIISGIYPATQNQRARGQNLLQKEAASSYLRLAKETGAAQLTHFLKTYQGVDAPAIVIPIQTPAGFRGWLAALLDHRVWFDRYLHSRDYKDLYLQICWVRFNENCYEYGERPLGWRDPFPFKTSILNQEVEVEASIHGMRRSATLTWLNWVFLLIVVTIAGVLAWVVYVALESHRNWREAISILKLRNASLYALTTELGPFVGELENWSHAHGRENDSESDALLRMLETQKRILADVQQIQRFSQERNALLLTETSLLESLQAATRSVSRRAQERGVHFDLHPSVLEAPKVVVDRDMLLESVFQPILMGLAEVMPLNGAVHISALSTRTSVTLEMTYKGRWSAMEIACREADPDAGLTDFRRENWSRETLGLLQAVILMEHFDGELSYATERNQTSLCLEFKRSRDIVDDVEADERRS